MEHARSGAKERIMSIAIAIILTMFIFYGISTFYKEPKWDEMCTSISMATDEEGCVANGGEWSSYERPVPKSIDSNETIPNGYCECKLYNDANEIYSKNVFIVSLIIGLIAVILSVTVIKLPSVAAGTMAGGILTVIIGVMRYWGNMPDFVRFLTLGVVLVILFIIAYKKIKN